MRRLLLEGGGRREHEARRMIRVGGRVETTMWQTPTLLQSCRHRRWWPARKKKQLEVVGANGPVLTSLRPRWCQQRLDIVAAAGQDSCPSLCTGSPTEASASSGNKSRRYYN